MYLLSRDSSGGLVLTKFTREHTPPYAILSHTWGTDDEEVHYDDIIKGEGRDKAGWNKIEFCLKCIDDDQLQYFWIDTCCINKPNHTELSEAINSMFQWYRNAEKCYVYLADLSMRHYEEIRRKRSFRTLDQDLPLEKTWVLDFRQSRWFTRGWTLQELLAPRSVEFYSSDGYRLGDRNSLSSLLHAITAIPFAALQGGPLSQYTVDERISWGNPRQTKIAEDAAYSLLGIVGVVMPLIYGEGKVSAFIRLRRKYHKELKPLKEIAGNEIENLKSLQAWRLTDPREDRERILSSKDPLLKGSCDWILEDLAFKRWWEDDDNHSLWIHGDPGKGKTMMMMALTDKISERLKGDPKSGISAFFFCQNTDQKLNSATAILRGLIFHLVAENRSLLRYLAKKYEQGGDEIFEGHNTLFTQWSTLLNIAHDPEVPRLYLLVDALDECSEESLRQFLTLLTSERVDSNSQIKWILTSRNKSYIDEKLAHGRTRCHISLESNATHITSAVSSFIAFKADQLTREKQYSVVLKHEVETYFHQHADNTFLWIALVCKELEKVPARKTKNTMGKFPTGLEPLYLRMLQNMTRENDEEDAIHCRKILQAVIIAQKPMHLNEIGHIAGLSEDLASDLQEVEDLIRSCGSFLAMRDKKIYLIHQSAKDFFTTGAGSHVFPVSHTEAHYRFTEWCFVIMSQLLKRDLCSLGQPGILINNIDSTTVNKAFPLHAQYACCYWGHHAQEGRVLEKNEQLVRKFLQERLLLWLEALSLMKQTIVSIQIVDKLLEMVKNQSHNLRAPLYDVKRFLLYCRPIIEQAPLQVYSSALLFAPTKSFVREQYEDDIEPWISLLPKTHDNWSALLQTLEGHSGSVSKIAFSPSGKQLASVDADNTILLWDATTCTLQNTLKGHPSTIRTIAFSQEGKQLVSVSENNIDYWDVGTGASLNMLQGRSQMHVGAIVAFSPDRKQLASAFGNIVHLWDVATRVLQCTLEGSADSVSFIAFSPGGKQLATGSGHTIHLWDTVTGGLQRQLRAGFLQVMAFSPDGRQLAWGSGPTIYLWDVVTGVLQRKLRAGFLQTLAFSPDGKQLASGSGHTIYIWDAVTGVLQRKLRAGFLQTMAFSLDGRQLASAAENTIYLWDAVTGALKNRLRGHSGHILTLTFSPDGTQLVSGSHSTIWLWDTDTEISPDNSEDHSDTILTVVFSPDGKQLVSGSEDHTVRLWDTATGALRCIAEGHSEAVTTVAFSPDGAKLVSGSDDTTVRLWDPVAGTLQNTLNGHTGSIVTVAYSQVGKQIASISNDNTIRLWNAETGFLLKILEHQGPTEAVAFSPDGKQLASGSLHKVIRLWDTATGTLQSEIDEPSGVSKTMAFSPDGKHLVSVPWGKAIPLWDTTTGYLQKTFEINLGSISRETSLVDKSLDSCSAVAFSLDGKQIAGGSSRDKIVWLWDAATGALQQYWNISCGGKLEFSADGERLEMHCGFIKLALTSTYNHDCTDVSSSCIVDGNWVRLRDRRAVRFPPGMRPIYSACKAGKIAIATLQGRILFMSFDPMLFPFRSL